MRHKFTLATVLLASCVVLQPFKASAYNLDNDAGGNGSIVVTDTGFTLTGSDYPSTDPLAGLAYLTSYTEIAPYDFIATFDWSFANSDTVDTASDLAGFLLDGSGTGLSDPSAATSANTGETFSVSAGQTYGWFVYTLDAQNGPGVLTVSNIQVPEPMSLLLLGSACSALGFARRRVTQAE